MNYPMKTEWHQFTETVGMENLIDQNWAHTMNPFGVHARASVNASENKTSSANEGRRDRTDFIRLTLELRKGFLLPLFQTNPCTPHMAHRRQKGEWGDGQDQDWQPYSFSWFFMRPFSRQI